MTYDVVLTGTDFRVIEVIKEVRDLTGLDLQRAKELVQGASPTAPVVVLEGVGRAAAPAATRALRQAGAVVEIEQVE
jgi:ribosomal protein L7/L12